MACESSSQATVEAVGNTRRQVGVPAPLASDTIPIGSNVEFVRPHRNLGILPVDSGDFRPYNADVTEPDTFAFVVEPEHYVVGPSGTGYRFASGGAPQAFVLPVDTGFVIERLAFTRIEGDPVFIVQESDVESGGGFVVRLDSATLRQHWRAHIPGFNVGFALQDGSDLYVTCIGFVGKLNVTTGHYTWRHDDLYVVEKFNGFERPRLTDQTVEFQAGDRILRIGRESGHRLPL